MDGKTASPSIAELRKQPHFSFSALSLYQSCSLAYRFRYIDRLQAEHGSKCLLFGSAYHRALDRIAARKQVGGSISFSEAKGVFAGEWRCQLDSAVNPDFDSEQEPQEMLFQGQRMLEAYLSVWSDPKIISHAQGFILDIPDADGKPMSKPVIGEYDLVVERNGKPVIVDFKSAGKKWAEDKPGKDLQATLYCYAYSKATGVIPQFRFDVVTKTKTPAVFQLETSRSEDDFTRLCKLYHSIDRAIQSEVYIPNENSFLCAGCEYSSACKDWHRRAVF